jgi:putative salt-induced outer membrane protein YdiY
MRHSLRAAGTAAFAAAVLGAAATSPAADAPGWYSIADLSFVLSEGNTRTNTLGVKGDLTRNWLRTSWRSNGSFVRTSVGEPTRRAVGTSATDAVLENGPRVTKAEKLFVNTDFLRRVTERFYWDVGGSLDRDRFAGLDSRLLGKAGVGYIWENREDARFSTGVAATFTRQDEVIDDPETEDSFPGVQFNADGERRFGDTNQHVYSSQLVVDENVQATEDLRFNWAHSLAVAMTRRLALKVGVQLAFDNQPQLVEFPLFVRTPQGLAETSGKIAGRAEKLDTTATVSLVINLTPGPSGARPGR